MEKIKTPEQIAKILKKDDGLALIKDLVDAEEKYYYSTESTFRSRGLKETQEDFIKAGGLKNNYLEIKYFFLADQWAPQEMKTNNTALFYKNASTTTYGINTRDKLQPTLLPREGYDGQVGLMPGKIYRITNQHVQQTGGSVTIVRSFEDIRVRLLKHELYENYLRTTNELPYINAHKEANTKFSGEYHDGTYKLIPQN
ncbi:MAG: hypothetical protein KL787_05675 [Taibaiella sp.]|nr:hypothetical protein [Taibaiella sp.]